MKPPHAMPDDEREQRIRDAMKRGAIEGHHRNIALGIFSTWRRGRELSEKQRWWLGQLTEMALAGPLVEDDDA